MGDPKTSVWLKVWSFLPRGTSVVLMSHGHVSCVWARAGGDCDQERDKRALCVCNKGVHCVHHRIVCTGRGWPGQKTRRVRSGCSEFSQRFPGMWPSWGAQHEDSMLRGITVSLTLVQVAGNSEPWKRGKVQEQPPPVPSEGEPST